MNNKKKNTSARRLCGLLVLSAVFAGVTVCVHSSSVLCPVLSRLSIYCITCWLGNGVSFPVAVFGVCTRSSEEWRPRFQFRWFCAAACRHFACSVTPGPTYRSVVSYLFFLCVFSVMHAWVKIGLYIYIYICVCVWQNVLCCVHFSGGGGRGGHPPTPPPPHTPPSFSRVYTSTPQSHPCRSLTICNNNKTHTHTHTDTHTHTHTNAADYRDRTSVCAHDVDVLKVLDNKRWCHYSYWPVLLVFCWIFFFFFFWSALT